MKRLTISLLCLAIACLLLPEAVAQYDIVEADDVRIDVTNWDVSVVRFDDVFPDVDNFTQGGNESWLRFVVEYTVAIAPGRQGRYRTPDNLWLDDLQLDWTVILAPLKDGDRYVDRAAVRMNKAVDYVNVKIGKARYFAVIYVEPRLLMRYASTINLQDIFVRIAFRVGRKTRQEMGAQGKEFGTSTSQLRNLAGAGRRGSLFVSEETVRPPLGLLNRRETPWEWSSNDSFETIVPPAQR